MNIEYKKILVVLISIIVIITSLCGIFFYMYSKTNNELRDTKVKLADNEIKLVHTQTLLSNTESELEDAKTQLLDLEIELDDTRAELSITTSQLNTTRSQLTATSNQLESEKSKNAQMLSQYEDFRKQIYKRIGYSTLDKQSFITPDNSFVSEKAQQVTGGYSEDTNEYYRDCDRLYKWVVNNISYSYDSYTPLIPESISGSLIWSKNFWRMPEETLFDETGDCEDMALLLTSLITSYNQGKYSVWCISISSNVEGVSGHMAVIFPVKNNNIAILEPAGHYYSGYQYGSLSSESLTIGINQWLSKWNKKIPGAYVSRVFAQDLYHEFNSTDEFLDWYKERY